jgi:hypothetical protein
MTNPPLKGIISYPVTPFDPVTGDVDTRRVRSCFALLRDLRDRGRELGLVGPGGLSMGMSGDYGIAVEEGATVVRVGQALFGARSLPDSHFWPANGTDTTTGEAP